MCGRYRLTSAERFKEKFNVEDDLDWSPRYNIAPTDLVPVIRQRPDRPARYASPLKWGLIPFWSKDPNMGVKMINARAEGISDKPAFREPFRNRRCLVPAEGFYEWQKLGKTKQPFHFGMADGSLFAFAGLWDRWRSPQGEVIESCSIITTGPNELMRDVHDRMPVILPEDAYELWLDPGFHRLGELSELLKPFDPALMKRFPVSVRVSSVKNDDAECIEEVRTLFA